MIRLEVDVATQKMSVYEDEKCLRIYMISTAKKGVGELKGSEQTPRGLHIVRAKIGSGCLPNTVFVGRRPTGEIFNEAYRNKFPNRDWILTRIMWLSGLEINKNRLGAVDTMQRYVYIHGTPDDVVLGRPGSRGCIRMRNDQIIELFDQVPVGTPIIIKG